MKKSICVLISGMALSVLAGAQEMRNLRIRVEWGHSAPAGTTFYLKPVAGSPGLTLESMAARDLEPGEGQSHGAWQTRAGGADVDSIEFVLRGAEPGRKTLQNMHVIWADTIAAADPDTARRLLQDASVKPDSPRLTIQMNAEGTRGFTVTADQLRTQRAMWIPSLHVYLTAGEDPVPFAQHRAKIAPYSGERVLERVRKTPEATYKQYTGLWEDMGSPDYVHPVQPPPGHIVGITWDSAIPKFGIDRGAGVWNDYGNPDKFRFWFDFGDLTKGISDTWKGQHLENGLPVITTLFEKDGTRYEVEQFAYPLEGPPKERRGDIGMVLLQRLRVTDLTGTDRDVAVSFTHRRMMPPFITGAFHSTRDGDTVLFRHETDGRVLFTVNGAEDVRWAGGADYQREMKRISGTLFASLRANGSREFVVKLASPMVSADDAHLLRSIDYAAARQQTLEFWSGYVARGAQFRVPDAAVNELFHANLWHALRLPRRHGGDAENVAIDLPYSNFAYSQTGTPWPVNQSVLVDYMLYDLRGYHSISAEELMVQFRNNQEQNGHVNGYANWVVYTPGMLYAVAKHFLLSGDRRSFDALLPASMKALDWCLNEVREAAGKPGNARGLVFGPVNDLTGEGIWGFNQAYMYAGLDLFGQALEQAGHPRAAESRAAARQVREAVERGFGAAAMLSPVVQLRDHTWQPYVPAEATTHRRMFDVWYPTDVDCGPVHMVRLEALPPDSPLSDWLLNDHEDNLYYRGLGIANEPVYIQQATGYLLRDEVNAAIRTFYSYMASGFSHTVFEPVEHRYTHGQYFGPPSTDGTWFELYRNMLVRERGDDSLLLAQAAPRAWLADGQRIEVERAPTYYGDLTMTIASRSGSGSISADVTMPQRRRPKELIVRLRHPEQKQLRSVTVNGKPWTNFDVQKEWISIPKPVEDRYRILASY